MYSLSSPIFDYGGGYKNYIRCSSYIFNESSNHNCDNSGYIKSKYNKQWIVQGNAPSISPSYTWDVITVNKVNNYGSVSNLVENARDDDKYRDCYSNRCLDFRFYIINANNDEVNGNANIY